ncbi:trihelix transcription factor GT-3b-like isoform X2 [Juglans microcarpa x Juglans regia]|uniref:trihelix transcription factor GT-3b-like isoform X2 n=1 Tax=Juglans microcarpa x Juglans regia TaxID=2249226 RepID=UPI001B7E77CC|nr:trihelix transcription factor GT-3b-like isoform X2 [Juglans microcarpa x Juglans regia]
MFGGRADVEGLGRMNMMKSVSLLNPNPNPKPPLERVGPQTPTQPQWSQQETREFIAIRAEVEMERDLTAATNANTISGVPNSGKRSKTTALWEVVSGRMSERGYKRTPEQCKCKWKNLLNRYKLVQGKETSDPDNVRQCPFFDQLHAVFTERAKNMQRLLLESEAGSSQAKKSFKRSTGDRSSDEISDEEDEDEYDSDGERPTKINSRRRKAERLSLDKPSRASNMGHASTSKNSDIQELLKEFFQQQHRMEMEWREMMERHVQERVFFEQEWRQTMAKLERERIMAEQTWREREEQRRMREETRAERRDALLTTLLNKLLHENNL